MHKGIRIGRGMVLIAGITGLFIAFMVAGFLIFSSPAAAQNSEGDASEVEIFDSDDVAEGPDVPITGSALDKASAIALEYIGGGRVTGTEVGDEEGYYEVEITRADGSQVDVHLDQAFNILGILDD